MGEFLKCSPHEKPFVLPPFRILQLLESATFRNRKDADVLESTGSLYVLCLHYSMTPELDTEVAHKVIPFLQTVLTESIVVIHRMTDNKLSFFHPKTFISSTQVQMESTDVFELMKNTFSICKDIVRDMMKQVRTARESQVNVAGARGRPPPVPADCYQAHSIYLLTSFAITHICAHLKRSENINAVPGLVNTLLVMCLHVPPDEEADKRRTSSRQRANTKRENILHENSEESRIDICMRTVNRLGFLAVNFCFTERIFQEVVIHM